MENITFTPISYLTGFHLHKPDYNSKAISGELFNFISEVTEKLFDIIPIDDSTFILKSRDNSLFEVRFHNTVLTYQDNIEFAKFQKNSLEILKKWQELNPKAKKLRIAGLQRIFLLFSKAPKGVYNSRIFDNYLKGFDLPGKKKQVSIKINYAYERKGLDYNIILDVDELFENKYTLEMKLDINKLDFNKIGNIDSNEVVKVLEFAEKYYQEEFRKDIGLENER